MEECKAHLVGLCEGGLFVSFSINQLNPFRTDNGSLLVNESTALISRLISTGPILKHCYHKMADSLSKAVFCFDDHEIMELP